MEYSMLHCKLTGNQTTCWGQSQEQATAEQHRQWKVQHRSPSILYDTECGLIISTVPHGLLRPLMDF